MSSSYLPIADYAVIGNLLTAALVGRNGSIDWCCLPNLDSPSVFAALLDAGKGGRFRMAPAGAGRGEQRYLPNTNVVETAFDAPGGRLVVTDFMPLRGSIVGCDDPLTEPAIHRILRCDAGAVDVEIEWAPRFGYAAWPTTVRATADGSAILATAAGEEVRLVGCPADAERLVVETEHGPVLRARARLASGAQVALRCRYGPEDAEHTLGRSLEALAATVAAWREWVEVGSARRTWAGRYTDAVVRSELALKLLTYPTTGAIAAAATTSLPEEIGGIRNWDYRYCWLRDASFTVHSLLAAGHGAEALDFLEWAQRASLARSPDAWSLRIMYGLRGEPVPPERPLEHLEGYCGSRPVRIGNAAATQEQHDIYGELMLSAYAFARQGGTLAPEILSFLSRVADRACLVWRKPDRGIWEVRGAPRHFVHSKVMSWGALHAAVRLAEGHGLAGEVDRWRRERDVVREAILRFGYDAEVGAFVQAFGSKALDASTLLIPLLGFLPAADPRVQGTIERIRERLMADGLVYRYLTDDGLPGQEGAFGLCTFWLVAALAGSGRVDEARELFEGMLARANHVGLYAEEIDPKTGAFLGNFPQAFTHIGLIHSSWQIARAGGAGHGAHQIGSQ